MKKNIARGVGFVAVGAATATMAVLGTGAANADALIGKTYEDALAKVADWNATPVLSTVTGDQLALDSCIVASWTNSSAIDALGESTGRRVLLNLNCNAKVAAAGVPGNSAATPQGKKAKQDIAAVARINKNPDNCFKNDDNLANCKRICDRTGGCEVEF